MQKRTVILFCFTAFMSLSGFVAGVSWDNEGGDRLWSNALNWSGDSLPTLTDQVSIAIASGPILNAPTAAVCHDARVGRNGGTTLTINGGILNVGQWVMIGIDRTNRPGTLVMNGGTVNLGTGGAVHGHLWIGYQSFGALTMTGGTINAPGRLGLGFSSGGGAAVNLYGGVVNAGDFSMTSSCTLNITWGVLVVNGDKTALINGYIANGWISAFGGDGAFLIDYNTTHIGKTTVAAVIDPQQASSPIPVNAATGVAPDSVLTWTAGAGAVSHDVYLGTVNPPPFVLNQTATIFDPEQLDLATTYYWRIDAVDGNETIVGDIWSFTTISGLASFPSPADGEMNVSTDSVLGWMAGYGAVSHDIYLGKDIRDVRNASRRIGDLVGDKEVGLGDLMILAEYWLEDPSGSEPYAGVVSDGSNVGLLDFALMAGNWMGPASPFFKGNIQDAEYDPHTLSSNTTYYWRVDTVEGREKRKGDVWSFKTTVSDSDYSLIGKVMCGYQGWFNTPTDGAGLGWVHWGRSGFSPTNCTVEMWPDMSEMGPDEKFLAPEFYDGRDHYVFSSYNRNTVLRHVRWMCDYGIDGAYVQRFATEVLPGTAHFNHRNAVLSHVKEGANVYDRKYAVMYDLSGLGAGGTAIVVNDWKYLVDTLAITRDPDDHAYMYHNGKPVVAVWGIGFNGRDYSHQECRDLVDFLKNDPVYGGNTVMIGVNDNWRTNSDPMVQATLQLADIISPWLVGRFSSTSGVNNWATTRGVPDKNWCVANGKDYLPVVFPGFSWSNLYPGSPMNQIPRNGGQFLWDQVKATLSTVGAEMLYVAMFDEVDEATAIFKVTNDPPRPNDVDMFVTYEGLPSDEYLWLTGQAGRALRSEIPANQTRPSREQE